MGCEGVVYRESVDMGGTDMDEDEINELIEQIEVDWPWEDYGITRHSCCIFSSALAD